jgi:hypothetical protein
MQAHPGQAGEPKKQPDEQPDDLALVRFQTSRTPFIRVDKREVSRRQAKGRENVLAHSSK